MACHHHLTNAPEYEIIRTSEWVKSMEQMQMNEDRKIAAVRTKIVSLVARILELPAGSISKNTKLVDCFETNPDAIRAFVTKLESALGIPISDISIEQCSTLDDLSVYCVERMTSEANGRTYVVTCRMPDGSVHEKYYRAKRHQTAEQLALDEGAEAILSVERADAEDRLGKRKTISKFWRRFMLPLILGSLTAVGGVAFFWYRRGCPKLW